MMPRNDVIKLTQNIPQWQVSGWNYAKFGYYA